MMSAKLPLSALFAAVESLPEDKRPVASISANYFNKVTVRVQWISFAGAIKDVSERVDRSTVTDDAAILALINKVCARAREEMK